MKRIGVLLALALFLALVGCEAYKGLGDPPPEEGDLGLGRRNYGASEGRYSMDNELCWQSIEPQSTSEAVIEQAHAKCMAEKGWGSPKDAPAASESR